MNSIDKIAILLATYNGENYISEQIESILHQTCQDWILYIHDDGSTDNTVEIIRAYENQYPEQIKVLDGPSTGGAKTNFLYMIGQVEAPYYMCADQDDVWLPEKIEITRDRMKKVEETDKIPCLVFTDLRVVDNNLQTIADRMSDYQGLDCKTLTFNRALIQNVVTGCTMMFNRSLREEIIRINDAKDMRMHDWWAALIALRLGKISYIDEATILYRQHGNNGVGAQNSASLMYNIKRMLQGEAIKKSLEDTRKQAAAFHEYMMERGAVGQDSRDTLAYEYARLGEQGKLKRFAFYRRNDVKKSTWKKNLGLMIWG